MLRPASDGEGGAGDGDQVKVTHAGSGGLRRFFKGNPSQPGWPWSLGLTALLWDLTMTMHHITTWGPRAGMCSLLLASRGGYIRPGSERLTWLDTNRG
jgi:hypothetical protein